MMRYAYARLKNAGCMNYKEESEDVLQDAFVRAIKYLDRIDIKYGKESVCSYMLTIVSNIIYERLKDGNDDISIDDIDDYPYDDRDFADSIMEKERCEDVVKAIDRLDEIYRITFTYRFRDGMSIKEIAEIMGISESTVKVRIHRGRKLLCDLLGEKEGS